MPAARPEIDPSVAWRPASPADAAGKSTMWGGVARKLRWPNGTRMAGEDSAGEDTVMVKTQ
jgi:hypothetical protein